MRADRPNVDVVCGRGVHAASDMGDPESLTAPVLKQNPLVRRFVDVGGEADSRDFDDVESILSYRENPVAPRMAWWLLTTSTRTTGKH